MDVSYLGILTVKPRELVEAVFLPKPLLKVEDTEAQRGQETCPRWSSSEVAALNLKAMFI